MLATLVSFLAASLAIVFGAVYLMGASLMAEEGHRVNSLFVNLGWILIVLNLGVLAMLAV